MERLARVVLSRLPAGGRVGVLGLSYKPETDVVEESQGLELARYLTEQHVSVVAYDPAASDNARAVLGDRVEFAGSAAECVKRSDVVAITTPWEEFRTLSPGPSKDGARPPVVVDCWRVLDRDRSQGWNDCILLGAKPRVSGGTDGSENARVGNV